MFAQGSAPLNTQVFTNIEAKIDNINSCQDLQALATKEMASVAAFVNAVNSNVAALQALEQLLTAPAANPAAIVTWITSFISLVIGPQYAALPKVLAQQAQLATQGAALIAKFEAKAASITNCAINVPAL